MANFEYTPEVGQVAGYTAQLGVKSTLANLAGDIGNLLTAKTVSDVKEAKKEAKYLKDVKKEELNEAQLQLMDEQDKLYEKYNTTADPDKRNQFVQEFEDNVDGIGRWYGLDGDNLTTFSKSKSGVTNKLRLYNSNVVGKVNDKINTSKANTADFATMDVANTKEMDSSVLTNNKDYLIKTEFGGDKAKYFDSKFNDFGIRLKESVAESTSVEEIDTLLENLDVFAKDKLGDTVSVNNKDATVDSTMYNGYHKNRQYLLEKRATAVTKLKTSLSTHIKGGNKKAYMETVDRIDKVGGFENPDLKQSSIDAWELKTKKANTSRINALKKQPDYVNGYADPSIVESTYKAHGGTDEQFIIDYKAKHTFTQNFLTNPINTDLTSDPKQAKIVSEDVVKKLVISGDIASAVDYAGKTGTGGVLKSYATSALSEEDPKVLTENVQSILQGYYSNQSVMSNNMETDDKSAMFFYAYQMRNGGQLSEMHIDRVQKGNAEGIVQKAGKEFNDEFAGKSNYTENVAIYSSLVKYGVPPQTAVDYIIKDTEAHVVNVSSGVFSSMDVDLRGAPNGIGTYDSDQLEEVLSPLVDKVNDIDVAGDKKLVYDKSTGDFRLFVDEVPMQDMQVNLDDIIQLKQKEDLEYEKGAWATTSRQIEDIWDTFMTGVGTTIQEGLAEFDKARHEHMKQSATQHTIRVSTNKAVKGETDAIKEPEYVGSVMDIALNSRENATALFNKDGINDYVNFLNHSFSNLLTQPLIVSEQGKVIIENTSVVDVAHPDGRKELQQAIENKQIEENKKPISTVTTYSDTMSYDETVALQKKIGATADGQWGANSQLQLDKYNAPSVDGSRIFASGKYQTIPGTLTLAVKAGYVKATDSFNSDTQEKVMDYLLKDKRKSITHFIEGKGTIDRAMLALAKEWASMPSPIPTKRGKIGDSYWGGANKSGTSLGDVRAILERAKKSGSDAELRAMIADHESGKAGYNAYNQGTRGNKIVAGKSKHVLTNMSIASILKANDNRQN